jgi:hypothetical protein
MKQPLPHSPNAKKVPLQQRHILLNSTSCPPCGVIVYRIYLKFKCIGIYNTKKNLTDVTLKGYLCVNEH